MQWHSSGEGIFLSFWTLQSPSRRYIATMLTFDLSISWCFMIFCSNNHTHLLLGFFFFFFFSELRVDGPLTRYAKMRATHVPGTPGTFSPLLTTKKPLVSDPGMHHDTGVMHVPWCMPGSQTRGGGENVPGIPGACATRNFAYLVRGQCRNTFTDSWGYSQNHLISKYFMAALRQFHYREISDISGCDMEIETMLSLSMYRLYIIPMALNWT